MEHIIKYYPVGNADCTLIKLDNGKTILVDCQILADLTDGHGKQIMFDVKEDLMAMWLIMIKIKTRMRLS